jgi:peptidoglycan/xylan/chitin deacetylase (PgdA/CDA1 family)
MKWAVLIGLLLLCTNFAPLQAADAVPQVRGDGTLRRMRVPILMYHYISVPPRNADGYRINLSLDPAVFRQHLEYFRENGFSTISLYDLDAALVEGVPLPAKPVILTFDDGYLDNYTNAFPLLQEFDMQGTFFIITGLADQNAAGYMNWAQIEEMAQAGMWLESHTKTHADLRGREYDFLVYELLGSIESLAAHVGNEQPRMFCYPGGKYDAKTLEVIRTTPIWRAVTTEFGATHTTDNAYQLPRLRISNETGVSGLDYLLRTAP